jgi:hypothetical protein
MHIIYAEKYVSPRERPLTTEEQEVRRRGWIGGCRHRIASEGRDA